MYIKILSLLAVNFGIYLTFYYDCDACTSKAIATDQGLNCKCAHLGFMIIQHMAHSTSVSSNAGASSTVE